MANPLLLTNNRIRATIQYLKKKWWLIALSAIVGISLGVVYCYIKRPLYTANLTFTLQDEDKSSAGGLLNIAAQFGFDLGGSVGGIFEGDNIVELFKSRKIIENTLLQPYENTSSSYADVFLDVMRRRGDLPAKMFPAKTDPKTFSRLQDSVMGQMHNFITTALLEVVKPDKRLNIFQVSFKTNDEKYTSSFTNTLVADVAKFYVETKTKKAHQNVDILQNRTDSIHRAFNSAIAGRAGILDANLNPAFQMPLVGAQQKQTEITVLGTAYGELLKNLELAKYSLLKETPLLQVIDEPRYPLEKKEYPYLLYVPLSFFVFTFLAIFGLIGLKITGMLYRTYWVAK
ncbi:MAG TPA: Wzz/FepE/Etk N-terminal domain-containing protein [Panacibacter sp.]|nr:Wzz/FepE/Etk N-terminal domain-containing protein [Panacibacter sp.]